MVTHIYMFFLLVLYFFVATPKNASMLFKRQNERNTFMGNVTPWVVSNEEKGVGVKLKVFDKFKILLMELKRSEQELIIAEAMETDLIESENIESEGMESEHNKLEAMESEQEEPKGLKPEKNEAEEIDPDKTESKNLEPDKTEPENLVPDKTELENLESGQNEPENLEPDQNEPEGIEQEKTDTESLEPDNDIPEGSESDNSEPESSQPDNNEPEEMEPDKTVPNGMDPVETESEEIESDKTESEEQNEYIDNSPKKRNNKSKSNKDWLIVNGNIASLDDFPYQAVVSKYTYYTDSWSLCGGSIVTNRHILTAAHCVAVESSYGPKPATLTYIKIVVGSRCLYDPRVELNAARVFIHRCYDTDVPVVHDVAVVKTKETIAFTRNVFFIKLPTFRDQHLLIQGQRREVMCIVAGWGRTSMDSGESNELRYTTLRLITLDKCKRIINIQTLNNDVHICAYRRGSNVCNGDSGGGLVCNLTGIRKVYGLVSFGVVGCTDLPAIYTRVDSHYKFIEDSINGVVGPGRVAVGPIFILTIIITALCSGSG